MNAYHDDKDVSQMKHIDPLFDPHQEFDWAEVERALGESFEDLGAIERDRLIRVLREFLRTVFPLRLEQGADAVAGRRVLAACWVLFPSWFQGVSQTELAQRLGCANKMAISSPASKFSAIFGVRNRGQSHGWNAAGLKRKKHDHKDVLHARDPEDTSTNPLQDDEDHEPKEPYNDD